MKKVIVLLEETDDVKEITLAIMQACPLIPAVVVTSIRELFEQLEPRTAVFSTRLVGDGECPTLLPARVQLENGGGIFLLYNEPEGLFNEQEGLDGWLPKPPPFTSDHELLARIIATIDLHTTLDTLAAEFLELKVCELTHPSLYARTKWREKLMTSPVI